MDIDVIKIKKAVKEGQLKFYVSREFDGYTHIYCQNNVGETVCVAETKDFYGDNNYGERSRL